MADINSITILGRLGQDVELRYTKSQIAVATLSVVTSKWKKNDDGSFEETSTQWHKIVCWKRVAEQVATFQKGDTVMLQGELTYRPWQDQNGDKKLSTEIIASSVHKIEKPGQKQKTQQRKADFEPPPLDEIPF